MPQSETEEIQSSYGDPKGKNKKIRNNQKQFIKSFPRRSRRTALFCFCFVNDKTKTKRCSSPTASRMRFLMIALGSRARTTGARWCLRLRAAGRCSYERVKPPRPGEVRPWVPAPVQPRPSRPSSRSLDSPHPSSPSPYFFKGF